MARYSIVHLDINRKDLIGVDNLRDVERNALSTKNAIISTEGQRHRRSISVRQVILWCVTSSIMTAMKKDSTQQALIKL